MENKLIDMQSQEDTRGLEIQRVGICDLKYPIKITTDDGKVIDSVANMEASVNLPSDQKGTHMSRFVEVIAEHSLFNYDDVKNILKELKAKLKSKNSFFSMSYTHFVEQQAPASGIKSFLDTIVEIDSSLDEEDNYTYILTLQLPVTSLCPCSKEISEYGAHNQRCYINIRIEIDSLIYVEELVDMVQSCGSCEIYSLLKRPDEKFVTERAYENPMFVEDISREVALKLNEVKNILSYEIRIESVESIHNHQAFAYIVK